MPEFANGDIAFIVLILAVIHGIMLALGWARRRKARRDGKTGPS